SVLGLRAGRHAHWRDGISAGARRRSHSSRLRAARQSTAWRWRRAAAAATPNERAPTPRWHLGRRRLGDPLLSAPRLRPGLAGAQGRIAQDVLDYPGAADRDLGGAGRSAARVIV